MAPAGTPRNVIDRLAMATRQALESDGLKKELAVEGNQPMYGTPGEFTSYYRTEVDKWAKLIPVIGTIGD
jgi:tripartite-type tricarboxylate transporter receptor subunit TctC